MNKVVHFEIPFDNAERAEKFYKQAFDWQIMAMPMPQGGNYYMATTVEMDEQQMPKEAGAINGGLTPRDATLQSPVLVVNVPELDAALETVKNAGGQVVMEKMQVMDMGLYARVKDTEGNVIGVWQDLKR
ncbi:VOC family protein [Candidatus Peregrinibacteria bacterium]|nr:VOC family protein [Candidatus Kerfeldbacteria bacterium]MBI4235305.1 VOC family protein [Candidatus Peregrinibacteria bacterium]